MKAGKQQVSTKQILAVLLVGGLGVVIYTQYKRGAFSSEGAIAAAVAAKEIEVSGLTPVIDVTLEKPHDVKIRPHSRNLFNYAKSPGEIHAEREAEEERRRAEAAAAERARLQAEAEAEARRKQAEFIAQNPPPPVAPPINFRFIGKMGDVRAPIAILEEASPGGEKYVVREGETILDKYKIIKIDFDSVTIGYVDPKFAAETKVIRMGS